jgi:hypothetical protein
MYAEVCGVWAGMFRLIYHLHIRATSLERLVLKFVVLEFVGLVTADRIWVKPPTRPSSLKK